MSDLIPNITITDLKKLKAPQIKELKSCEIYSDGEYLCTLIIPHGDVNTKDYGKTQADYLGQKTNIVGGRDLEEV
ncbi:MAG: hypothetical protein WC910_11195 [Bacteroidales bacterium]|jgi:hypothetical protein